jgi:hypothetical protein
MDTLPSREELRELFAEDDRRRAEHEDYMARRAARAASSVREIDGSGLLYRDLDNNALTAAPAVEAEPEYDFTEPQFEALAQVLAEPRKEFDDKIERTTQRLLDMMVRMAVPAERAEETAYGLKDRVARMESYVERQIATVIERHMDSLRNENAEIRVMLGRALELFKQRAADVPDIGETIELPNGFLRRTHVA